MKQKMLKKINGFKIIFEFFLKGLAEGLMRIGLAGGSTGLKCSTLHLDSQEKFLIPSTNNLSSIS